MYDNINDEQIGRLFDLLEKRTNELEKIPSLFSLRHGNMTGDHGINLQKDAVLWKALVKVPLIIFLGRDIFNKE